jgi:hypothetical protein
MNCEHTSRERLATRKTSATYSSGALCALVKRPRNSVMSTAFSENLLLSAEQCSRDRLTKGSRDRRREGVAHLPVRGRLATGELPSVGKSL